MARYVDKPCECCGQMMYNVNSLRRVCMPCQKLRHRLKRHEYYEQMRNNATPEQIARRPISQLEKDSAAADRCGLSYGHYKLKMSGLI